MPCFEDSMCIRQAPWQLVRRKWYRPISRALRRMFERSSAVALA